VSLLEYEAASLGNFLEMSENIYQVIRRHISEDGIPKRKFNSFLRGLFLKKVISNSGLTSGQPLRHFEVLQQNLCSVFMILNTDI
jgi:hypothetical protein